MLLESLALLLPPGVGHGWIEAFGHESEIAKRLNQPFTNLARLDTLLSDRPTLGDVQLMVGFGIEVQSEINQ